jgi:KDO2-lipid IV(A) lauroyltransferase
MSSGPSPATHVKWSAQALAVLTFAFLAELLTERAARLVARLIGALLFVLLPRQRARIGRNLELVFGGNLSPESREKLTRRVFEHHALTVCEVFRATPAWLERNVRVEGEEISRAAMADRRGLIVVSGHFGNFELLSAMWRRHGLVNSMMSRPMPNIYIEALLCGRRARCGARTVGRRRDGLREILLRLRAGESVGWALDLNTPKRAAFINAWGIPAATARGPATLALKHDIPVVLMVIYREPDGRHVTRMFPPFRLIRTGNFERDVAANLQMFTDALQEQVLKHPEQYYWQYARWRTRPDGRTYPRRAEYEREVAGDRAGPAIPAPAGW